MESFKAVGSEAADVVIMQVSAERKEILRFPTSANRFFSFILLPREALKAKCCQGQGDPRQVFTSSQSTHEHGRQLNIFKINRDHWKGAHSVVICMQ